MSDSTGNTPDPAGNQTSTPVRRPRRTAQPAEYYQSKLTGPTQAVSLTKTAKAPGSASRARRRTPAGQGTSTARTGPCSKVATD